ncbi:GGDEF domain-containing protein [Macromonas bipunctata]|uniref:GGDEF domain-containing protein n=1 Tax=Macromonas bipunctata TaxID=183670 RepID=UPI0030B8600D
MLESLDNDRDAQADVAVHGQRQHHPSQHHGAVIYLDLDNFKPLNDRHGHVAGDRLLQEVGHRLLSSVRGQDTVARLGGDEFVVLLIELNPDWSMAIQEATLVAEKLRETLARNYVLSIDKNGGPTKTVEHQCTASLGVTVFRPSESNADAILRRADDAMYRSKAKGRNQIRFADEWLG